MIAYVFSPEDLLRIRFAISPLFEATASLPALREPGHYSLHLPWIRAARERLVGVDYGMLDALIPDAGYTPDFISPPPETPLPDVAAEIERVRRTPAAQVRRELGSLFEGRRPPAVVRPLIDEPRHGLRTLATQLRDYWRAAMAPDWEALRAVLEEDIAHRARVLASSGAHAVFAGLHPDVRWSGRALEIDRSYEASVQLDGRGLQLVPSAFVRDGIGAMLDLPWQPALIYPPRGVGWLWAPKRDDEGALAALLGARRAQVLAGLDAETTTTDLARRLTASPAGTSEHLSVLRRAGLVCSRRDGRAVLYSRTAAGDALLRAP